MKSEDGEGQCDFLFIMIPFMPGCEQCMTDQLDMDFWL
jgi:hypothetical protein